MKYQNKQICRVRRPAYLTKTNKQAFTLIELIVVITILAILWIIAFISLQWYSSQARDSTRLSDIQNIKKSLELFSLNTWKYPKPDDYHTMSYSWDILWYQWTVWDQVTTNLSRNLNETPTDPLTGIEYTYSIIHNQIEYELLALYESDLVSKSIENIRTNLIFNTNALFQGFPKIEGNYNGVFVKTDNFIVATPSITNADIWEDIILSHSTIKSQIVTGWDNIPWESTWWLDITLSVYEWDITEESTDEEKEELLEVLQTAYSWSELADETIYADILSLTGTEDIVEFVDIVVLNETEYTSSSSPSSPSISYSNCDSWTIIWETYSSIDYDYNELNHWVTTTWVWTESILNWTQEYTALIECSDWIISIDNESLWDITCDSWYAEQWWACVADECNWSIPNNATSNASSQSVSWTWSYNVTPWLCTFVCNNNYTWDWNSSCTDQTPPVISSVNSSSPSCNTIRFTISASDVIWLNASAYSFDWWSSWQTSNYKDYSSTSLTKNASDFKVRDIVWNIVTYWSNVSWSSSTCAPTYTYSWYTGSRWSCSASPYRWTRWSRWSCSASPYRWTRWSRWSCSASPYRWTRWSRWSCSASPYRWTRWSRWTCSVSCWWWTKYRYRTCYWTSWTQYRYRTCYWTSWTQYRYRTCYWTSWTQYRYRTCYWTSWTQSRTVYCKRSDWEQVSDTYCTESKPSTSISCSASCVWSSSDSTSCSASCVWSSSDSTSCSASCVWSSSDSTSCSASCVWSSSDSTSCNTQSCCDSSMGNVCKVMCEKFRTYNSQINICWWDDSLCWGSGQPSCYTQLNTSLWTSRYSWSSCPSSFEWCSWVWYEWVYYSQKWTMTIQCDWSCQ